MTIDARHRQSFLFSCMCFLFLILLQFFSSSASFAEIAGGKQTFSLDYKIEYINKTGRKISMDLTVPVAADFKPHQKILAMKFFPKPSKIIDGANGKFAVFSFKQLEPGKTVRFGYTAKIAAFRLFYDVNADRITGNVPAEVKSSLKETPRYPINNKTIKSLLRKLISGEPNTYYRVLKCYDYVRNLHFELTRGAVPVIEVVNKGICQCSDATDLFITLCRSLGVPARYCGGIFLKESLTTIIDTHAWAEVYFPPYGWVPVDPTMGRFDEITRLNRFCEMDSPYILLWRNIANPFSIKLNNSTKQLSSKDFTLKVSYKALNGRKGISLKKIYPPLSLEMKNVKTPSIMSSKPAANDALNSANNLFAKGKLKEAEEKLKKAVSIDPGFIPAYRKMVDVYEKQNKLNTLKNELLAKEKDPASRGSAYYAMGIIGMKDDSYSHALGNFRNALKYGATPFIIHYNMGVLYKKGKQIPQAAKFLQASMKENPRAFQAYNTFIELMQYLEDYPSIIELCNTAIKLMPLPAFYDQKARAYMSMGKYKEALESGNIAIKKDPRQGAWYATMGRIHLKSGNVGKGEEFIQKAIKNGVTGEEREYLKRILKKAKMKH